MDQIIVGVDTHKSNHVAVAINTQGARLGSLTIPATSQGYCDLEQWAKDFGPVKAFGIEGTGSFGAGLSRSLLAHNQTVIEVMRPNRQLRYLQGKSDSLDAEGAARSVLNGQAKAIAKIQTGSAEMIRHLKVVRDSAVKSKSQAMITLKTLIINAPAQLRDHLDQPLGDCCAFVCRSLDQRQYPSGAPYRRPETGRHHLTDNLGQGSNARHRAPLARPA